MHRTAPRPRIAATPSRPPAHFSDSRLFAVATAFTLSALLLSACDGSAPPPGTVTRASTLYIRDKFVIMPGLYPGVTRTRGGDLLVTADYRIARSRDNGRTWLVPDVVRVPPEIGVPVGAGATMSITTLSDGTILWPLNEEKVNVPYTDRECRLYVLRSEDDGRMWSQTRPVPVDLREAWAYGKIVELPDGVLLMPVWGMRVLGERWRSGLLRSFDHGRTWGDHRTIAWDPYAGGREDNGFNEATLALLPSGEVLGIVRQQMVGIYPDERPDFYDEPAQELFRTFSLDGGATWALPQRLPLRGTSPSLHISPRGTLLLGTRDTAQRPDDKAVRGVAVRASYDRGLTWEGELQLVDPERGDDRTGWQGYPAFQNLPDGRILVVYYSGLRDGQTRQLRIIGNILEEAPE